ncbi:MAG: hypothetical protein MJ014_01115 [Methanocorpusculum sp.]|nr:hypothetical protein [Methanocorpusculum sp.]
MVSDPLSTRIPVSAPESSSLLFRISEDPLPASTDMHHDLRTQYLRIISNTGVTNIGVRSPETSIADP